MVGAAPTSAELTGQLMALLPNINCTGNFMRIFPSCPFLTCRVVSLPGIWPHRDYHNRVHGPFAQEGRNFGICRAAFTWYSGEVAQARWDVWRARGTGRAGGL